MLTHDRFNAVDETVVRRQGQLFGQWIEVVKNSRGDSQRSKGFCRRGRLVLVYRVVAHMDKISLGRSRQAGPRHERLDESAKRRSVPHVYVRDTGVEICERELNCASCVDHCEPSAATA